jgi:hypothetical protein
LPSAVTQWAANKSAPESLAFSAGRTVRGTKTPAWQ